MTGLERRLAALWYPDPAGRPGRPPAPLRLAEALYRAVVLRRALALDRGRPPVLRAPVPCVSVGNLTVGGTGKTPLVSWIVGRLARAGVRPAILLRGYGGRARGPQRVYAATGAAARFGDEAALLAGRHRDVPVFVGRDRHAAAVMAAATGAGVVVADDAFQHRRLARDLDIVTVDASRGFGNRRLLPAGPLREPPEGLDRAGAVVLTRIGEAVDAAALRREVAALAPRALVAEADLCAEGLADARTGAAAELPPGAGVYAFSGVGNPDSFHRGLAALGLEPVGREDFRDHHAYRAGELERIAARALAAGAAAVVTTDKDAVRIPRWPGVLPLYRVEAKLDIIRGRERLWGILEHLAAPGRG